MVARLAGVMCVLAVALAVASVPTAQGGGPPIGSSSPYTVSRTTNGIQVTVHFRRHAYQARAQIAVTATLRNISHQHLAVSRTRYPYGLCSWPVISLVSVDATGRNAEPLPPIPAPVPSCPFLIPKTLAIGGSIVEHQFIVLWTPRLRITAQVFNFAHNCYCGFELSGPSAHFQLFSSQAPTIALRNEGGITTAAITPPPGAHGPVYYRSWGSCDTPYGQPVPGRQVAAAYYWAPWQTRIISSGCSAPQRWHLDVAWLNTPVASPNLGAGRD